MILSPSTRERLQFLTRVSGKEARDLATTTERLFATPFTPERIAAASAELPQSPLFC